MDAGHYSMNQFARSNYVMSSHLPGLERSQCQLIVKQQPKLGRVALGEEKNRKPLDPPPIVQLRINRDADPEQSYMQSPYFFVSCNLVQTPGSIAPQSTGTSLAGTLVSSLHRLKDSDNNEGAFFIFGDLAIKLEGFYALQFNLYEMRESECFHILSVLSEGFPVHGPKNFPGLSESTALTRSFSDQGVRLRVRKEPRSLLRKRGPASDNYIPRSYNRQRLHIEISEEQAGDDDSPISSRNSQSEQQASMQSPQQMNSGYSQSSFGAYPEEPATKRPRTDSEQVQQQGFSQESHQYQYTQQSHQISFGHQRPSQLVIPSQSPLLRLFIESVDSDTTGIDPNLEQSPSFEPYNIQPQHQQAFVESYAASGGSYFSQPGPITPGSQQSGPASFTPHAHPLYQQPQSYGGQFSPQVMPGVDSQYGGLGVADSFRRSGIGTAEIVPSRFSRTASVPGYIPTISSQGDRGTSYGLPGQIFTNQNLPPGMGLGSSRSPTAQPPITTGGGSMDNAYE